MSASPGITEYRSALVPPQSQILSGEDSVLESPSMIRRLGWMMTNPWKNTLLPAAFLRWLLSRSRSPLIAESLARPGGWRAMEIIYAQAPAVGWLDRQALHDSAVCMAARNRRRIVTGILTQLLAGTPTDFPITMLGIGAGPIRWAPADPIQEEKDQLAGEVCRYRQAAEERLVLIDRIHREAARLRKELDEHVRTALAASSPQPKAA